MQSRWRAFGYLRGQKCCRVKENEQGRQLHRSTTIDGNSTFFLWCQLAELEGGLAKPPSIHLKENTLKTVAAARFHPGIVTKKLQPS
jgi:hypothetical protein